LIEHEGSKDGEEDSAFRSLLPSRSWCSNPDCLPQSSRRTQRRKEQVFLCVLGDVGG